MCLPKGHPQFRQRQSWIDVILIDILKNAVLVFIRGWLIGNVGDYVLLGRELAGLCAMFGNAFPVYYEFRGGKGVMAMSIILFFIDWRIALTTWGAFFVLLLLTKYVSLCAIIGRVFYPPRSACSGSVGYGNF